MMFIEARCNECREIFVPHSVSEEDLEHWVREDGEECGGVGSVTRLLFDSYEQLQGALLHRLVTGTEGMPPIGFRPSPEIAGGLMEEDIHAIEAALEPAKPTPMPEQTRRVDSTPKPTKPGKHRR